LARRTQLIFPSSLKSECSFYPDVSKGRLTR
jgi:hypothetical protein